MEPETWVVLPASRSDMVWRAISNFQEQDYKNKHLIVVENGEAVGSYAPFDCVDKVLKSEQHPGTARNAALDWLSAHHPDAYVVCMDDDDYYGSGYLSEHVEQAERGVIRGKWAGWTQFDSELVYFGENWKPNSSVDHLLGATLGFFVADAPRFPEGTICGEDTAFCTLAKNKGLEVKTLSSSHFCCSREGDPNEHTHKANERKYWRRFGPTGIRVEGGWEEWINGPPPEGPIERYS